MTRTFHLLVAALLLVLPAASGLQVDDMPRVSVTITPWEEFPGYLKVAPSSCWTQQHTTHLLAGTDADSIVDLGSTRQTRPSGDPECPWRNAGSGFAMKLDGTFSSPAGCYFAIAWVADNRGTQQVGAGAAHATFCVDAPSP